MISLRRMNRAVRQLAEVRAYARHLRSPVPLLWKGRYAGKTPGKLCSCEMCGNPRRWFGTRTRQEQRAMLDAPEALAEPAWHPYEWCECERCWGSVMREPDDVHGHAPLLHRPFASLSSSS